MPDSDTPKDPTSPAGGPRCWDTGEKAPGDERPQRRAAAPGLAGGVGVYRGERSPSWLLPSFPFLRDPSHCSSGCARLRPAKAPPSPEPAPRLGLGASQGPARGCWPLGSFKGAGQRKVSLLPRLSEVPRVSRKARSRRPLPLLFAAPVLQELGTEEPRLHLSGVTRARCSARPARLETPSLAAAALLSRLPGPPRAPGELGQWPRDAGAARLPAPAPQLAGPAAPGGRGGGGGGGRRALPETRC